MKHKLWSKLQKQLYNIMDREYNFQIHCSVYKTKSAWNAGQRNGISKKQEAIPRFWITIGKNKDKKILWDFPNNYLSYESQIEEPWWKDIEKYPNIINETYFASTNYIWVSKVIKSYIDTPREKLLDITFPEDKYGLVDILRKYDKRISKHIRQNL